MIGHLRVDEAGHEEVDKLARRGPGCESFESRKIWGVQPSVQKSGSHAGRAVVQRRAAWPALVSSPPLSLSSDWEDPGKTTVDEIITEWRSQGGKGRYEEAMWRAAGLEPP